MSDYSLVPVDHQPDFENASLVPVDHDPFSEDGATPQAQSQQAQTQIQPAQAQPPDQPEQPATGADQPGFNGPASGSGADGSSGGNARTDPRNPTSHQGSSSAPTLFPGYADPTPMAYHQAKMDAQEGVNKTDAGAGRGSGDIRQKIADLASGQISSGAWDFDVAKGNFPKKTDKCNLFVYDILSGAGASPGLPNGWWRHYPPTAANWADPSFAIPGWRVLSSGESPQPGDVVGQRIQWPNGATGHVMIVGPNANFIGVGESEKIESVAAKMMGENYPDPNARPGGLLVYRRYEP